MKNLKNIIKEDNEEYKIPGKNMRKGISYEIKTVLEESNTKEIEEDPVEPADQIDLKKEFSEEEKEIIIKTKAEKRFERGGFDTKERAYQRAKEETMSTEKYKAYSQIALHIFDTLGIKANRNNLHFSTNRHAQHSWYINLHKGKEAYCIKISDHFGAIDCFNNQEGLPIMSTILVNQEEDIYYELNRTIIKDMKKADISIYRIIDELRREEGISGVDNFIKAIEINDEERKKSAKEIYAPIDPEIERITKKIKETKKLIDQKEREITRTRNNFIEAIYRFQEDFPTVKHTYDTSEQGHIGNIFGDIRKMGPEYINLDECLLYKIISPEQYKQFSGEKELKEKIQLERIQLEENLDKLKLELRERETELKQQQKEELEKKGANRNLSLNSVGFSDLKNIVNNDY